MGQTGAGTNRLAMDKGPLVSVVVPTYNRAGTVARAIDSVLQQSHSNLEVIVVDDASLDNTGEVLKRAQQDDPRVLYHRNVRNQGPAEARNTGIAMATGQYVTFLDDDDEYYPNKVAHQIAVFSDNPEVDVVVGGVPQDWCSRCDQSADWVEMEFCPNKLFQSCYVMCRRRVLQDARFRCNYMEWRDFAFQLYEKGFRVRLSSEKEVRKGHTAGSLSRNEEAMLLAALENAKRYCESSRGKGEHAIFRNYLANCHKNVANYSLKRGRPWRAIRGYADAFRTRRRIRDLMPFV